MKFLDTIFSECASRYPDKAVLVVEDGSRSLSFSQLNTKVSILSEAIKNTILASATPDNHMISIMINRDIGMIVAILAVLKTGCAYVPVDPSFPPDRQSYIFSHSQSKCLIADSISHQSALKLGVTLPPVLIIESETGNPIIDHMTKSNDMNNNDNISLSRHEDDVAYVLYTSGSTGKPKGVMVTHANTINCIKWFAENLKVTINDKILALATFCFDISVLEFFLSLLYGASLVIAVSETQKDPYRILDVLERHSISIMQATPTTYEMLLAIGWHGNKNMQFIVSINIF